MPEVNEQCPSASYALCSFGLINNTKQAKMPRGVKLPGRQKDLFLFNELSELSSASCASP
jgi:hypothetical protein